jgi:hypothetical protein
MITKTLRFIQGHLGKVLLFSLMASTLYMAYGCVAYRQVPMPKDDFMANQQIQRFLDHYSIYVHEGDAIYRMENVEIIDQRDIAGRLVADTYAMPDDTWKRAERKAWWKAHKYDVHVYTHDNMRLTASTDAGLPVVQERVVLKDQMIKEIRVMGIDMKKSVSAAVIVLIVLGSLIVFPLLLVLSIWASVESSNGGSGSDSDSDSDSGDSSGS